MYTHNLDPILFDFGFMVIRWYSLAYIFGILIGSAGIESLSRFASYLDSVEFFIDRNKKSTLLNYKIAGFYRFGRFGYEVGLSRRGIGVKIMWYLNY